MNYENIQFNLYLYYGVTSILIIYLKLKIIYMYTIYLLSQEESKGSNFPHPYNLFVKSEFQKNKKRKQTQILIDHYIS